MKAVDRLLRTPVCLMLALSWVLPWAVVPSAAAGNRADLAHRVVLPDTCGAITEIVMNYDSDLAWETSPMFRDLFEALPSDIDIRVHCESQASAREFILRWGSSAKAQGRRVRIVNVGLGLTTWARDRVLARSADDAFGRPDNVVPAPDPAYGGERLNELYVPEMIRASQLGPAICNTWIHFEGGNVVSNQKHAFVGINVLEENGTRNTSSLILSELRRVLGREIILVQDRRGDVPWCHVDMYLTPVDNETVLVGSTAVGFALLDGESLDDGASTDDSDGCFDSVDDESFDAVASQMENLGYKVFRLPVVPYGDGDWMVTYNNVLMETRDGSKVVYMPTYNLPRLDGFAEQVYRALGYEVRPIDVSRLYRLGGAVRCVVNVTRRSSENSVAPPRDRSGSIPIRYTDLEKHKRPRRRA